MSQEDLSHPDLNGTLGLSDGDLLAILREGAEQVFLMLGSAGELVGCESCEEIPVQQMADVAYEVLIEFSGPLDGVVLMRCQESCARSITRGLLMMEDSEALATDEIHDALGECTNMLGGFFKRQALDPKGSFQLGIPRVDEYQASERAIAKGQLVFELSDSRASVEVWLTGKH